MNKSINMYGKKMSKAYFFQTIEKRLKDLEKEVEEIKAEKNLPLEQRNAKENILFGRLIELQRINSAAMNVDYWKYSELDRKIEEIRDKI